jgi:hypothetical protein
MARRSREGYYVDVTSEGITVGSPVDSFSIGHDEIRRVKPALFFPHNPSLTVICGRRRIVIRKMLKADRGTEKTPLVAWLKTPAPSRTEIRAGMRELKETLDALADRPK